MGNYYEYDREFDDDAALSSSSFLTPLLNNQPRSRIPLNLDDEVSIKARVDDTYKRLIRMRANECSICMVPLENNPSDQKKLDSFVKTPCNHRFHKTCLTEWMTQKL